MNNEEKKENITEITQFSREILTPSTSMMNITLYISIIMLIWGILTETVEMHCVFFKG